MGEVPLYSVCDLPLDPANNLPPWGGAHGGHGGITVSRSLKKQSAEMRQRGSVPVSSAAKISVLKAQRGKELGR